ncbi:hypothetical protein FGG78_21680 [Thioclava sp. BHET1]|nr:hypothetical protein FGG78_21680 [Thioclava sp. BHET1]
MTPPTDLTHAPQAQAQQTDAALAIIRDPARYGADHELRLMAWCVLANARGRSVTQHRLRAEIRGKTRAALPHDRPEDGLRPTGQNTSTRQ